MASALRTCIDLCRHLGPRWLAFRMAYAARLRSGLVRAAQPEGRWSDHPLSRYVSDPSFDEPDRYFEHRRSCRSRFLFKPSDRFESAKQFAAWDRDVEQAADPTPLPIREGPREGQSVRVPHDIPNLFPPHERVDGIALTPIPIADDVLDGVFRCFEHHAVRAGFPPDWHANVFTGERAPAYEHWTCIRESDVGDIKLVWELNRFAFTFPLVRAYWRTGDESYPEAFWQLVLDWRKHNRPNCGVNWKCGQEISLRVMAWCFGLYGFGDSPATTPERVHALARMIAASAARIESNIGYALSQKNNHGVSEAAGLWTVGLLFPELQSAEHSRNLGRTLLERQAAELIDDDGAFSQHSLNYHRVTLHVCLWSLRLGDLNGEELSPQFREKIGKAAEFLYQLMDLETGGVPNYGQNDSALTLPLTNAGPHDYRPVIQSAAVLTHGCRRLPAGVWDEELAWLAGFDAHEPHSEPPSLLGRGRGRVEALPREDNCGFRTSLQPVPADCGLDDRRTSHGHECGHAQESARPPRQTDLVARHSGYYTLRSKHGFAFTRCGKYRHRPSHADCLHVDLWWQGQNIAIDPGTYSYHAPPPWRNPLAGTACHNTVTVDGRDQMERVARFLWLPWLKGRVTRYVENSRGTAFQAVSRTDSQHGQNAHATFESLRGTCFQAVFPRGSQHGQDAHATFERLEYWEGEHDGYQRLDWPVLHRRGILLFGGEHWLIVDRLTSRGSHDYRLHWLFADFPHAWDKARRQLRLTTPNGEFVVQLFSANDSDDVPSSETDSAATTLVRAEPDGPRGWRASAYHSREPALSLAVDVRGENVLFYTLLGAAPAELTSDAAGVHVHTAAGTLSVDFPLKGNEPAALIRLIRHEGENCDRCGHAGFRRQGSGVSEEPGYANLTSDF